MPFRLIRGRWPGWLEQRIARCTSLDPAPLVDRDASPEAFRAVVGSVEVGGVFKITSADRHPDCDDLLLGRLDLSGATVLDVGASDGTTSLELVRRLPPDFAAFVVSDRWLRLLALRLRWHTLLIDPASKRCVLVFGRRVVAWPERSRIVRAFYAPLLRAATRTKRLEEVSMLNPDLRRLIASDPRVTAVEHDVFEVWTGPTPDVIKVANLLRRIYFEDEEICRALDALRRSLSEGGHLLVVDNPYLDIGSRPASTAGTPTASSSWRLLPRCPRSTTWSSPATRVQPSAARRCRLGRFSVRVATRARDATFARARRSPMPGSVVVAGARTPIGKLSGALASLGAAQLGGIAIAAALERAGISGSDVDYVVMGQVLLAGAGQVPARQAAIAAGIPMSTPACVVDKVCLSGLNALYQADLMIAAGDAEVVVAGGMESMSAAPYLLPGARAGYRLGSAQVLDSMMHDGLEDAGSHDAMGLDTERYLPSFPGITRERQDAFAAASHQRAARATKDGLLAEEIVSLSVPQRRGDEVLVDSDEGIRPTTTLESLAALRPAFSAGGTVTAGNASQISDGASALVVMSKAAAEHHGATPLGEVVSYGMVAGPDTCLLTQPSRAAARALERAGLAPSDVDLYEINEAFAAVALGSMDDLGLPEDVVNVNGGAVALGHPIGMSGNRLALTLLHELRRRGGGAGVAALCGGGGQGDAVVLRTP